MVSVMWTTGLVRNGLKPPYTLHTSYMGVTRGENEVGVTFTILLIFMLGLKTKAHLLIQCINSTSSTLSQHPKIKQGWIQTEGTISKRV